MNHRSILLVAVFLAVVAPHRVSGAVEELPAANLVVLNGMNAAVRRLAWQPGGGLVSVDVEGNLAVWDVSKGKIVHSKSILDQKRFVREMELFDQGRRFFIAFNLKVVTGSLPSMTVDDQPIANYEKGPPTWHASVSPDGQWIAVAGVPKKVAVVAVTDKRVVAEIEPADGVEDVVFLPDGRLAVASGGSKGVAIFVVGQTKPSLTLPFSQRMTDITVSPDGSMLAGVAGDVAEVFQIKEGATKMQMASKGANYYGVSWTADSSLVAANSTNGLVRFWDPHTGELKKQLTLTDGQTTCMAFSPDGKWLAIGCGSYMVPGSKPAQIIQGDNAVRLLRLDRPASGFASTSVQTARTWTSTDGKKIVASFVKLSGAAVVLRMGDGKEYSVPKDRLSEMDKAVLTELLKKDTTQSARSLVDSLLDGMADKLAAPQNYRFNVGWSKSQVSVAPKKVAQGYEGKVTTWTPKFKVTNNSGKDLAGLTLIYQVQIKLDRDKSQDDYAFPTGSKPLPLIKNNQTIEVEGKNFETLSAKLQSGYITKDRSRANKSDDVMGVVVKILHVNKLVHEYKSGTGVQDKLGEKLNGVGLEKGK